jgi:two-component system cell cycle response regulator
MGAGAPRILIAEDSPLQRAIYVDLLHARGFEVHAAEDGRMALDLCRMLHPDLVILDLGLPRLTGAEVLARIRADRKLANTAVLVLSADERESSLSSALDGGATDYIVKGARPGEIAARVRHALREKAERDALIEQNQALSHAADIDALTGLPNRRAVAQALAAAAADRRMQGHPLAIAMVDIDHFKRVNDTYGHAAGDRVLCAIAGRLRDHTRPGATLGRWGGEEFMAVLTGVVDPSDAAIAAEDLRDASAADDIRLEQHRLAITVSVGWACGTPTEPERLVELADGALYAAKASGRNCVRAAA